MIFFENTTTLKDLKDQEREINNEYRKISLKRNKLERKRQLPTFNGNKKKKSDQFGRHELSDFIKHVDNFSIIIFHCYIRF